MYSIEQGCTEIHSVGGHHPNLPFDYYLRLLRTLKEQMPQVHLKFFTASEIHHLARISKLSLNCEDYLRNYIYYDLGPQEIEGMTLFYDLAIKHNHVPAGNQIRFTLMK